MELLALPGWQTPPTPLNDWVERLKAQGHDVTTERESTGVCWVEVPALRLRGYAVLQGQAVEAINFELTAPDPSPARLALDHAAQALGWELHEDDEADDDEDDE